MTPLLETETLANLKSRHLWLLLLNMIFIYILYIIYYIYPHIDDFAYHNLLSASTIDRNAFINVGQISTPGTDFIITFISQISGIPLDVLAAIPMLSISFIFTLIMFFNKFCNELNLAILLTIAYLFISNMPPGLLFCHEIGFFLLCVYIYLILLRYESRNLNRSSYSLLIMMSIISLNLISYKMVIFSIIYLTILGIIYRIFFASQIKGRYNGDYTILIVFAIVIVLYFNNFLYRSILPFFDKSFEISHTSGIAKLFSIILPREYIFDPMIDYYFRSPREIAIVHSIFLLFIFIFLAICILSLIKKFSRRTELDFNDGILLVFILATGVLFLLYSKLGLAEMGYFIFSSFIGIAWLNKNPIKNYKRISLIFLSILLTLNIAMQIAYLESDFFAGQHDANSFDYLSPSASWYFKNFIFDDYINEISNSNDPQLQFFSDVFTEGYFSKETSLLNRHLPATFLFLTISEMLSIVDHIPTRNKYRNIYIINYREDHFVTMGWLKFKSWKNYKNLIESNPYLLNIYSDINVDYLMRIPSNTGV